MSQEIETKRFARRSITVKGLAHFDDELPENAIHAMSEYGVHWNLYGRVELEVKKGIIETTFIGGEELPSGLTQKEKDWVLALAEKHGLDIGITSQEVETALAVPMSRSRILIHNPDEGEWEKSWIVSSAEISIELSRYEKSLYITVEGNDKQSVSNQAVDDWVQDRIKLVRDSLRHAGFTEKSLEIDCEIIMGAEREAKCDPDFMRSLLTTDKESEEE